MAQLSLSRLPWWGQILAFVALSIGAVYAVETYYVAPMLDELRTREQRLAALRGDIARGLATAQRLPQFRTQVADLERRLDALKSVLPEQKDVGDLLRRLQTLATQSNLTIRAFTPRPIAQKQLHAEWPIGLELEGTYHNLGMFFDRVSRFPRIITIGDLKIRAKEPPEPTATITAECTATTFVLLERPAGAPAAGPPGARPGAA
ncbi:MAG TPA: type 4a pilus biogenesis protein PilO, partial [Vicinamibacterales bacterium]|nr:type 4a pilus biogenesis protein PilO [Vicinamibacterales bacterium]